MAHSLVVTKLSKLTSAEFSPRNDCGVFLVAPVDGLGPAEGNISPIKFNSNGSELLLLECVPFAFGELLFRFVIMSNSSKSVEELWLVGDQGSLRAAPASGSVFDTWMGFHGSGLLEATVGGCHGSTCDWVACGGDETECDCHVLDWYRHQKTLQKKYHQIHLQDLPSKINIYEIRGLW